MLQNKFWINNYIEETEVEILSKDTGLSHLLSRVLLDRGMRDKNLIRKFLNPSLKDLYDPFLLKDMDKTAERIYQAVKKKEKVVIYGDYDVDGVTSIAILLNFLSRQGVDVNIYIPDRMSEGYGLSIGALERIRKTEPDLIITVDCGITAVEEAKYLKEFEIDMIITDHHECGECLPDAYAVVNPHRHDCRYPFKELAGVGVVFKLISAVCKMMDMGDMYYDYLDLTALGTIADVVELTGENRIIARYGIQKMQNSENIGLKTLVECTGVKDKPITTGTVGFILAPRINAAGRLGDAGRGVELFTTGDAKRACEIVSELNEENKQRQDMQDNIFSQAVEIIEREIDLEKNKVIVIADEGWHPGVIGIVASKITEKYYRPSILICKEGGVGKGSCRSIGGFNIYKALCHCDDFLLRYGGHELAAGLSLEYDRINEFVRMINEYADTVLDSEDLVPKLKVSAYIPGEDISIESVRELEKLAPFGQGNPRPLFACNGLKVKTIRTVGNDKHLKMVVEGEGFRVDAIGFNMSEFINIYYNNDCLDLAFSLEINTWKSQQKVQMNLKDIRPNKDMPCNNLCYYQLDKCIEFKDLNDYNSYNRILESIKLISEKRFLSNVSEIVPERMELAAVYKYLTGYGKERIKIDNLFSFARQVSASYRVGMNYFKVKKSVEILEELKLLKKEQSGNYGCVIELLDRKKTSLESSVLYQGLQNFKKYLGELFN